MNVKIGKTEPEKRILFAINEDWLALRREEPIDPAMPIVDPHHHLWDRGSRYLLDELKRDIDTSGHNIRASVFFLQCDSMYRADGDPRFVPIGETEFVNGIAAMSASGTYGPARLCAGIVGFADLFLGAAVDEVLEAHLRAAGERFKGVRYCSVWDADKSIKSTPMEFPKGLLLDSKFREGFAHLSSYGLSFDSWIYHTQIPEAHRPCPNFSGHDNRSRPYWSAARHRCVRRTTRRSVRGLAAQHPRTRQMSKCAREARRHRHAPSRSSRFHRPRRISPRCGDRLSKLASKHSVRSAQCSRAIFRSTSAITATAYSGTPSSGWPRAIAPMRRRSFS